jgi:hypothetical protein
VACRASLDALLKRKSTGVQSIAWSLKWLSCLGLYYTCHIGIKVILFLLSLHIFIFVKYVSLQSYNFTGAPCDEHIFETVVHAVCQFLYSNTELVVYSIQLLYQFKLGWLIRLVKPPIHCLSCACSCFQFPKL